MSTQNILHFTIGPVQGFVAQARRTRDLWAGSFLLSFLAAHAMKTIIDNGGSIEFPYVHDKKNRKINITDPLLAAVMGQPLDRNPDPVIGSVPNRFKAIVPIGFDPNIVTNSVNDKWASLAKVVFDDCLVKPLKAHSTELFEQRKTLWDQQISEFWNINWVMSELEISSADQNDKQPDKQWLDQRKNWRTSWLSEQGGEKCSLMGDWQELSMYSVYDTKNRREFWQTVAQASKGGARNIRDGEYLCAISLVKRLFPTLSANSLRQTIGWVPGGDLRRLSNWPSTTYMAALPWLLEAYRDPEKHLALNRYLQLIVNQLTSKTDQQLLMSEQANSFQGLVGRRIASLKVSSTNGQAFYPDDIDGDLLNEHSLENYRSTHLSVKAMRTSGIPTEDPDAELRNTLKAGLAALYRELSPSTMQELKPRSYYAILIMDGDKLGELLNTYAHDAQQKVSKPLSKFTSKVPITVAEHNGLTLYAGGDDVLAMLPMSTALQCAHMLNQNYRSVFNKQEVEHATASAAVLFTHHQYPLSSALKMAHKTLKRVAKEGNGRDSCAVSVLNSGGQHLLWVNAWNKLDDTELAAQGSSHQLLALKQLVEQFDNEKLPRGFPHKLKRQFAYMQASTRSARQSASQSTGDNNSESTRLMQTEHLQKLFLAELLMSEEASTRDDQRPQKEQAIKHYLAASQRFQNHPSSAQSQLNGVQFDAGLIARFLSKRSD